MKNVLEYLELMSKKYPKKRLFCDKDKESSYEEFQKDIKSIGSGLIKYGYINKPICIFLDKSVDCLNAMFGVVYSGNFYTIMDTKMPLDRINNIFSTLEPKLIITNNKYENKVKELGFDGDIVKIEDLLLENIDEVELMRIRDLQVDTDPLYVLFTSGSTGNPKGTVLTHKSVISYTNWFKNEFEINNDTIFGSQTQFYFSMSVSDIFGTISSGATLCIIPKMYFSFPMKLIEYLNEKKINTIYWVPSAMAIVANFKTFDKILPEYLNKILFAGEVMPTKILNEWRRNIPNAIYANLFGPTETTDICSFYVVDREISNSEVLPIGKHCDNCNLIIMKENGQEAEYGEEGELCVRGSFLASGYYNNLEKTNSVFIQNPLNNKYPEVIYKTGDIVKYNEKGELIYKSRKDFQIKHMGYRIELGEIEAAVNSMDDILACACVYDFEKSNIVLFAQSKSIDEVSIIEYVKNKVPQYMVPNRVIKLDVMPINANGKIDRALLKSRI